MKTSGNLVEHVKIDCAVLPKSVASTAEVGAYFDMSKFAKALFVFSAAAMADTKTVIAQVMKATDGIGTGGVVLTSAAATITAPVRATKANLAGNTIVDTTTVVTLSVLKGGTEVVSQLFTCEDTDPDIDAGEYASGASDTTACVALAAAINHLLGDYLVATPSTTNVILTIANPGEYTLSLEDAHSSIVPSFLEAIGYIEVDHAELVDTFTHVALRLTTDATIVVGGALIRSGARHSHTTEVAAAKVF